MPWMNNRERLGETGLPGSRTPAASESLETFNHPSLRPFFFQRAFSRASTSRGRRKLTALSAPTLATLTTMALIACPTRPRLAGCCLMGS